MYLRPPDKSVFENYFSYFSKRNKLWVFMVLFSSADFFQNLLAKNTIRVSICQTVWKCNQQTIKVTACEERVKCSNES